MADCELPGRAKPVHFLSFGIGALATRSLGVFGVGETEQHPLGLLAESIVFRGLERRAHLFLLDSRLDRCPWEEVPTRLHDDEHAQSSTYMPRRICSGLIDLG